MRQETSRAQIWSAFLGNLFEHYDTALFGFLSPFIATLIFPKEEPVMALILTYAIIPLGMLARPVGSLLFGYVGDNFGRHRALFWSMSGMGFVSLLIAFAPTYAQVGILAPLIFCAARLLQNLFASGEMIGGAVFLLENSERRRHDLVSSFYNASTIAGILLASAGVALLAAMEGVEGSWRYLYVFGCITALFGVILRRPSGKNCELPTRDRSKEYKFAKLLQIFWLERRALFSIMIVSGFSYANYLVVFVLMNGFVPLVTTLTKAQMMELNTLLLILDFFLLFLFGWITTKVRREIIMGGAALASFLLALPLFLMLEGGGMASVVAARVVIVSLGVAFFAPFYAWAQEQVPAAHRYAVIALGYSLGSQLFGGPTAALSLWIYKTTGIVSSAAWYWMLLSGISVFILLGINKLRQLAKSGSSRLRKAASLLR